MFYATLHTSRVDTHNEGGTVMNFTDFLRDPIFLEKAESAEGIRNRMKLEEHPYVFLQKDHHVYAISSVALFVDDLTGPPQEVFISHGSRIQVLKWSDVAGRSLDILAQEVTLIEQENKQLKYLCRDDYLLSMMSSERDSDISWLRTLFSSIPKGLMTVDLSFKPVNFNTEALRMFKISATEMQSLRLDDLFGAVKFIQVRDTQAPLLNQVIGIPSRSTTLLVDIAPLVVEHELTGFALVLQDLPSVETMAMELLSVKRLNQDLQAILSTIYDEIIVVDKHGTILRASDHYITSQWTHPPNTLIGEHVLKFKSEDDVLYRTITEVQKTNHKTSLMQSGKNPVLVAGNPIFTESKKLDRIVIASRDLTEVTRLRRELEQTRKRGESYRQQLEVLRERTNQGPYSGLVYASPLMDEVMEEVNRVAPFTTTVLLIGESGVGKEVIADVIHTSSERRDGSFIKINCGAIPETLLESELFGYEKGAFSGANQQGKVGLFVKAHGGTLFLDEVSELPLSLQVKLLRAIQDLEVYPVGGTEPVKFDVRIIAATNRNLKQRVDEGTFREDLYYRINVYPIEIPPLRKRHEDIAVLLNYYLNQFNRTYGRSLRFSRTAIELLEAYEFPGNVREVQNIVQRVAIKADGDVIDVPNVEQVLIPRATPGASTSRRFEQLIPLDVAIKEVEEELILLAMDRYHSTTKAAKVLGVNQSTISRKYRQIMNQSDEKKEKV
jgi:transcriptional regulator with PAS, ATPase and Fis domain